MILKLICIFSAICAFDVIKIYWQFGLARTDFCKLCITSIAKPRLSSLINFIFDVHIDSFYQSDNARIIIIDRYWGHRKIHFYREEKWIFAFSLAANTAQCDRNRNLMSISPVNDWTEIAGNGGLSIFFDAKMSLSEIVSNGFSNEVAVGFL